MWEALLSQQAAFRKEPGVDVLRGLVARRLFGSFADTKRQAVGKQIFTFDDAGSFCMCKVSTCSDQSSFVRVKLFALQSQGGRIHCSMAWLGLLFHP